MHKFLIFISALLVACSDPSSTVEKNESKPRNGGWEYQWHNEYTKVVNLDSSSEILDTGWISLRTFCLGKAYGIANVWGSGNESKGLYLSEFLPAFFKRRLDFKEFTPADGSLTWIFTGDKGGITVLVDSQKMVLSQRFYNSIALNEINDGKMFMRRYGDREIVRSVVAYNGKIKSLKVEMTSNQQVRLFINGVMVAEQLCMQDLTQHQLRYSGQRGSVCGDVETPVAARVEIKVNPEISHQEIIGFGGITSMPAYYQLSEEGQKQWWGLLKEYNLSIQREYPNGSKLNRDCSNFDSLDQATPHYYGDNFPNGEISDFSYNKRILEMGGMIIFEFWQLPKWVVKPGTKDAPLYDKYAEAMISYCKQSVAKTGKAPEIVGIQNEIEQSDTAWQQMALHLTKGAGLKRIRGNKNPYA